MASHFLPRNAAVYFVSRADYPVKFPPDLEIHPSDKDTIRDIVQYGQEKMAVLTRSVPSVDAARAFTGFDHVVQRKEDPERNTTYYWINMRLPFNVMMEDDVLAGVRALCPLYIHKVGWATNWTSMSIEVYATLYTKLRPSPNPTPTQHIILNPQYRPIEGAGEMHNQVDEERGWFAFMRPRKQDRTS